MFISIGEASREFEAELTKHGVATMVSGSPRRGAPGCDGGCVG